MQIHHIYLDKCNAYKNLNFYKIHSNLIMSNIYNSIHIA